MQLHKWLNDTIQQNIWTNKYQHDNETLDGWFKRVSNGDTDLEQLLRDKKFLFGGRILANRGLDKKGRKITYSNCYVLPQPEDNIESIFDTAKALARTFSYGGGVGIDISKLRPKGAKVNNSALETTGAVSFMDLFSLTTGLIGQNGRRGALMISIDVNHPDIEEFIDVKKDLEKVTKANISIKVNKEFMEAVKSDSMYKCQFIVEDTGEKIVRLINARELFMKLAKNNWEMAEPGILFWDNITNYNLMSEIEELSYAGVNPCAEQPLPGGGSCLLGAINLSEYVVNPFSDNAYFSFETFKKDVNTCVFALNDVLIQGLSLHPLDVQKETVNEYRQIGLGVMGIADMLIKLGYKYGEENSNHVMNTIGKLMLNTSIQASGLYKQEYDYSDFKHFTPEKILNCAMNKHFTEETKKSILENGMFNSQLLTVAPTGSISTMLGVSGGIEPHFALKYTRKTESLHKEGDVYYNVDAPIVEQYKAHHGIKEEGLEMLPDFFVTAQNLYSRKRVEVQGVWQQYIDASISSTVNLPEDTTVDEVFDIYLHAHNCGLKGLTIYRDNCFRPGILTVETPKVEEEVTHDIVCGVEDNTKVTCPECGSEIANSGGCGFCLNCGYSGCK